MILLALLVAADALETLEPVLKAAERSPVVALTAVVRGERADPLTPDDLAEALPVVDAVLDAHSGHPSTLDRALADASCALPADVERAQRRALALVDVLLMASTVDAAAGKPFGAGVQLGRAADVARLLVRCDGASLATLDASRAALGRLRARVIALLDAGWIDKSGAARAAGAIELPGEAELLHCAGPLATRADIEVVRKRLKEDQKAVRALGTRLQSAPASVPEGDRVQLADVAVRCQPGPDASRFIVSRPVLAVLRARGALAVLSDSQLMPLLTGGGRGVRITHAGPAAKSCGLRDGDVLLAVNGQSVLGLADLAAVQQAVNRDQRAALSVRRGPAATTILLEPKDPVLGP